MAREVVAVVDVNVRVYGDCGHQVSSENAHQALKKGEAVMVSFTAADIGCKACGGTSGVSGFRRSALLRSLTDDL